MLHKVIKGTTSNIWNVLMLKYTKDSVAIEFSPAANFADTVMSTRGWDLLQDQHQGESALLTAENVSPPLPKTIPIPYSSAMAFSIPSSEMFFILSSKYVGNAGVVSEEKETGAKEGGEGKERGVAEGSFLLPTQTMCTWQETFGKGGSTQQLPQNTVCLVGASQCRARLKVYFHLKMFC